MIAKFGNFGIYFIGLFIGKKNGMVWYVVSVCSNYVSIVCGLKESPLKFKP